MEIKDWLAYDETSPSGLRWLQDVRSGRGNGKVNVVAGSPAGSVDSNGRWVVGFKSKNLFAHRLVLEVLYGPIPEGFDIDHEDGDHSNNRKSNLRLATKTVNMRNRSMAKSNSSGVTGVCKRSIKGSPYWTATWAGLDGKPKGKWFNCNLLGEDTAFEMAVKHRIQMIDQLNASGASYTARHGKEKRNGCS